MINTLEKLAAWIVFSLAILTVYGFLSVAWAGIDAPETTDDSRLPLVTTCTTEQEFTYDANHRELLGMPPGKCVPPLPGYPSAAAGWLAAVKAQAEADKARGCVVVKNEENGDVYGTWCPGDGEPQE